MPVCFKPFLLQRPFILLLLITVYILPLNAQNNNKFQHITVEQGLSQSAVFSIARDSTGFMWFGTKDGLNRYDARRIEVYKNKPKDTTSLSSNVNINALLVDKEGTLWVGTQHGLNKYIAQNNTFKRFLNNPKDPKSLSNNVIRCLYQDKQGNIWVGTEKGLNKMSADESFQRFYSATDKTQGLPSAFIKAIYQDEDQAYWVGTNAGLSKMLQTASKSYTFKNFAYEKDNINSLAGNDVSSITEDKHKNIWIGLRYKGLNRLDKRTGKFTRFNTSNSNILNNDDVRKLKIDRKGKLWIGTLNGITVYNPIDNKVENRFVNEPEDSFTLGQNSVYDIYEDKIGTMWVGTYYGGVNVIPAYRVPFSSYQHFSYKNSLSGNVVSAIVEDDKHNLWIGTEGDGVNYYNRQTGKFEALKNKPGAPNSLSSNLIKSLVLDKNGELWIAAFEGGLDIYNPRTGSFKNYNKSSALNTNRLTALLADRENRIWLGSRNRGLFQFDKLNNTFIPIRSITSKFVNYLYEDNTGTIWVAMDDGLFFKEPQQTHFVNITLKENPAWFLGVNSMLQDSQGRYWIATGTGLILFKKQENVARLYTENQGLPTNNIVGILEDDQQNIWVSTAKGIAKLTPGGFAIYNKEDGFPGNVFNHNSFFKDSKGELFFGGYNGMISFWPQLIRKNMEKPKVVLTKLKLSGDREVLVNDATNILNESIGFVKKIGIPYNEKVFSVDFAVLDYITSSKNKYAYKLDGIDKQWNYLEKPTISFNNLSDGDYTLLFKGANNDGVWSNENVLKIKIYPPFWKSWWAYLIYIAVLFAIAFVSIRYFIIRQLLHKEHEIHQLKIAFFRNVSHEIRTPLTLISGPLQKLITENQENNYLNYQLLGIHKHVKRLTKLINELLDFSKVEAGKMDLRVQPVNIVEFVHQIYQAYSYEASEKALDYIFESPKAEIIVFIDRSQMEKVIYNLLSNAFKFVPYEGKIIISIAEDNEKLYIRIKDSGKGIAPENRAKIFADFYQEESEQRNAGTGIGLALSKSIVRLHDGDLEVEDSTTLTVFKLSLKKGSTHFADFQVVKTEEYIAVTQPNLEIEIPQGTENTKAEIPVGKHLPYILVVEDNREVRDFIISTLKNKYQVRTAENGAQGLELALDIIPDIIISDVMMPVMNGIDFCRTIKSDDRTNHIPVILLTARSGEADELEGLKTGADLYMAKPFTIDKLLYSLANLINLQHSLREKFTQKLSLEPNTPVIEHPDGHFIEKVLKVLEENINNPDFGVNEFAYEIGMSTPVFYKKIKAVTGLTVNNFIKSFRLKRAVQLLDQKAGTISEVAYIVGFTDPKYFSKEFKKQFGKTPSEYIDEVGI
ncbi:hybrid sensor histidine kinase/response regulator transcription factor [Pseudopedobacter beijingensis]|uniref:histidine kinase n=1 Tax=Pseudopedobacter beijingensis TaxID=1207056 RepID=A0ABW4IGP8_9SPHI